MSPSTTPVPCFIGGSGQTGKTTLKHLLGAHARVVHYSGEIRILTDPDGLLSYLRIVENHSDPFEVDVATYRLLRLLRAVAGSAHKRAPDVLRPRTSEKEPTRAHRIVRAARVRYLGSSLSAAYGTLNFQAECERYGRLVAELEQSIATPYSGRWMGMARFRPSRIYVPPLELERVTAAIKKFLAEFLSCAAAGSDATHVVDDTPYAALRFPDILRVLPDARLIYMHRNPLTLVSALVGKRWAPTDVSLAAQLVLYIEQRWMYVRDRLPEGAFLEISFDELIIDPHAALSRVASFLDIAPIPEWGVVDLRGHRRDNRVLLTDSEAQIVRSILGRAES